MHNVIALNPVIMPGLLASKAAKVMWDKTKQAQKLSEVLSTYAAKLEPIIAAEKDEEARYQLRLIRTQLQALVEGPVLKLFERYDDQLVEMGDA